MAAVMMLGTALLTMQAVSGSSLFFSVNTIESIQGQPTPAHETAPSVPASSSHSMNSRPEVQLFFAAPWISAGLIRMSDNASSFIKSTHQYARDYTLIPYPKDHSRWITDRSIRLLVNSAYTLQTLNLQIARLTAG